MAVKIQLRRDTASNWSANNPILAEGEIGIETDTTLIKVGDGTTNWNSLGYINTADMTKSVYDTNDNGIVDKAESLDDGTNTATAADVKSAVDLKHTQGSDTTLGVMTADVDMGNNKITNIKDPVYDVDAVNLKTLGEATSASNYNFFLSNAAADVNGYYYGYDVDNGNAANSLTSPTLTTGDNQLLWSFISEAGKPNLTLLSLGIYTSNLYLSETGGKDVTVIRELYKRTSDGTEALLLTSQASDPLTDALTQYSYSTSNPNDIILDPTDRLVYKLFANVSGVGTDVTVTLDMEGNYDSRISLAVTSNSFSNIFAEKDLSNVTDATVLDKIKNVDGSGSGLDADLLDGFDASQNPNTNQIPVVAGRPNTGNYTITGIEPATSSTLTSNISSGYAMINGYVVATPTTSHTYTASKDTYIFLDQNGNFIFSEVDNGAAAPSKPANTCGVAKVVTDGSGITSVTKTNYNTFSGYQAGNNNTIGYANTFSGYQAGNNNTTGYYNTFLGTYSGFYNTIGHHNTFSGYASGFHNTIGYANTFLGFQVGNNNTTGYYNTFLGYYAGFYIADGATYNQTSNSSIIMGYNAHQKADGDSNEIVIGHIAIGNGSNTFVLGNINTGILYTESGSLKYKKPDGTITTLVS